MSKEVFVSYSRDDSKFADRLATDLYSRGIEVWMDKKRIKPGDPWDSTVQKALIECEYFMVVLSPISVSSQNVLDEINYALNNSKRVLPVLVLDIKDGDIPLRLSRIQWIDFRKGYDEGFSKLVAEFQRYGFNLRSSEDAPNVEAAPDRSKELRSYYVQGESSFLLENWENAISNYQAVVNIQPDYRDAAKKLDQARRSFNHERYYTQVQNAMEKKDWEHAIGIIVKIQGETPNYKDVDTLLLKARDQKYLAELYEEAQRDASNDQWQDVFIALDKIFAKDPSFLDPLDLRKTATEKMNEHKAEELYSSALSEMGVQNYSRAYSLFNQVSRINPNYLETRKLIKKIEAMGVISNVYAMDKKEPAPETAPPPQTRSTYNTTTTTPQATTQPEKVVEKSQVPGQSKSKSSQNTILLIAVIAVVSLCVCSLMAYGFLSSLSGY
jgi:tetratricopeptide (TPR) repeat protein